MKKILAIVLSVISLSAFAPAGDQQPAPPKSFYSLTIKAIDGKQLLDFSAFKGKKVLLVNTASRCGFTGQYKDLEALYQKYKGKLVVVAFPCNQFGEQEPDSAAKIETFCRTRYSVTFPMTEKIDVKGDNQHTVYQWLTHKKYNGKEDINVRWNFGKFLVDEKGKFVQYFPSEVEPLDARITSRIEAAQ